MAIVTYAHRPKWAPRKRKAVAIEVPAVVRRVKAGNDNRPDPEPALHPDDGKQSAIVTAKKGSPDDSFKIARYRAMHITLAFECDFERGL
jgi:hypothetical protein